MRIASAVLVGFLASGCGTTATIHRWGAPPLEAQIVESDSTSVYVEDDQGNRYRVPRSSLTDVDHPGNVALGIGIGLLAMGSILYFADDDASRDSDEARRTMALAYSMPGAILAGWGGFSWWRSRSAASRVGSEQALPMPTLVPVGMADVVLPPGTLARPKSAAASDPPAPAPGTPEAFAPRPPPVPVPNP